MSGALHLVATPIGNLGDLTQRALEVLKAVDFIICEDTRHTRGLLNHFGIGGELVSLPGFDEAQRVGPFVERLLKGQSAALVSDAGSPAISDPGERLVRVAVEAGVTVHPIPGPSAAIAALSASGLATDRFHFLGFLPRKGEPRRVLLDEVEPLAATLIVYESPRRLGETLAELAERFGARRACVARELTKMHEEFDRGSLVDLAERYREREVLGEIVLLIEGRTVVERWGENEVRAALEKGLARGDRLKDLAREIAKAAGWVTGDVYRLGVKGGD